MSAIASGKNIGTGRALRALLVAALLAVLLPPWVAPAAFAATVSDDFSRADGALGANWTTVPGTAAPAIVSNRVQPGTAGQLNSAYWSADTFGADQFAQATLPNSSGSQYGPGIAVRLNGATGYFLWYGNSAGVVSLWRMDGSSSWTLLASSSALSVAATDVWRIEAVGSTLTGFQNGTQVVRATDTRYSSGAPGVWLYYGANQVTNWSGGDVPPATGYTVGGTATGLSGTLVLQDNGGDDLSVAGDGPFTFASPVTGGSPYAVTVRTAPPGQTCTVANGSGTVGAASVTDVAVSCTALSLTGSAQDDFNRADGALGNGWTDSVDGGLSILSQVVTGAASGLAGDIRGSETYDADQYSQLEVTSTQLTGSQWIGPEVRAAGGGQTAYVGMYYWNSGSPQLRLYERAGPSFTQLVAAYNCGPLAAGTTLRLMVVGSTLSFLENGVERLAVYDASLTSGVPGIMAYGAGRADNWSAGTAGFEVHYLGTDATGVESYDAISANNGYGPQTVRVLRPDNPAPGMPHNFLYVLPVEAGQGNAYGDGLATLQALDAQNAYNLTIIEPSFAIAPWYADNPVDPNLRHETFMTAELLPWVKANLASTSSEQQWLIGFSKSGLGAQDLLLRHPDLFTQAAAWDFPADMSSYSQYGASFAYGTEANFQANYRLTSGFLDGRKAPFVTGNRIWIGSYDLFRTDATDFDSLLTSKGVPHATETPQLMSHRWDSGWVPMAVAALHQNGVALAG
jgi:esterase/lipase superfamily enzyme